MTAIEIDARGMRCPWPALRLARAMREGGQGAEARLRADDPVALREITALAAAHGWQLVEEAADCWRISAIARS